MITEHMPGGPTMNLTSANEHVPEIKRIIIVVKETVICVRHSLPFNRIPRLLIIHVCVCFRPPSRPVCLNHEVAEFQPWTVTGPYLGSTNNTYTIFLSPRPTFSNRVLDHFYPSPMPISPRPYLICLCKNYKLLHKKRSSINCARTQYHHVRRYLAL